MKGAEQIARILQTEQVENLFSFPNNPIIEECAKIKVRPIVARMERTVLGMADSYTRVTNGRKTGVAVCQYGPGVENAFGAMAQAYSDSTPMLFMPAGFPQTRMDSAPVFEAVKNYQYVTKWAARVNKVERVPEFMRRAFTYLRNGRPGPVLLELPMDVAEAEGECKGDYLSPRRARSMADPEDVRNAVKALIAAKRPMIQAGVGILYAEAWQELVELAELLQVPVSTTNQGKSAFPEDHPLSLGAGSMAWTWAVKKWLAESDLIFGAGSALAISAYDAPIPAGKTAIQLTIDERDVNRDYVVALPLAGDAKLVLRQMIEEAQKQLGKEGRKGDDKVAREIQAVKDEWYADFMPQLTDNDTPINPYRIIWDLQQAVDLRNTIATHDAGTPRDHMVPFWKALEPNSYIGWGKSTHLGYGIPMALGAKVAHPEKTVLNVMGDLAFGMNGLDIETGVRNKLGILTIVMNNGLMGDYLKRLPTATAEYGSMFISGNYSKIAEGLGAYTERVDQPQEIIPAVKRALKEMETGRPALLEMMTREVLKFSR